MRGSFLKIVLASSISIFACSSSAYALDLKKTLRDAGRVLDPGGTIIREIIIEKKKPSEAIKETVDANVEALKAPINLHNKIENAAIEVVRKELGDDIANALSLGQMPDAVVRSTAVTIIDKTGQLLTGEKTLEESVNELIGLPLAGALKQAYDALLPRSKPLPDDVRTALYAGFDRSLIDNARFVVTSLEGNLPAIVNTLNTKIGESDGSNHAVTVGNVIAFETLPTVADIKFWAHEIIHTRQYKELGIDGFAAKYVTNYRSIEEEAKIGSQVFVDLLQKATELAQLRQKLQ